MFAFSRAFFLALLTAVPRVSRASFERDVVAASAIRDSDQKMGLDHILSSLWPMLEETMEDPSSDIHQELLAKAMPIREFEAKYGANVMEKENNIDSSSRELEQNNNNDDDMNGYSMISFSGYSLKFAKCQPVQYFSEKALQMGEHSAMITNDIVVLRLCPTNTCSASAKYGCQYNFSEYAMELAEYVRIMLKYAAAKRDYMCNYCNTCLANGNNGNRARRKSRRLEDANAANEGGNNEGEQQQAEEQQQGNYGQAEEYEDNEQAASDDGYDDDGGSSNSYDYSSKACSTWSTYCSSYGNLCVNDEGNDGDAYMAYEDYLDYLYCSEVEYNNYAYFVKPRCDGFQGTIKMGVYYDKYCSQYAGNEVSLKNFGKGFRDSVFQHFYNSSCLDCSESDYPPYDATSTLCNRLHRSAAKCTADLSYDLFGDGEEDDSTECSFIESIRFGTYNELGQFTTRDAAIAQEMTDAQKTALVVAVGLCIGLVIYACYLHHAMTNLLIKSLSHRELLPPSRHQSRSRASSGSVGPSRRSSRRGKKLNEPDWDDDNGGSTGELA